jgi:hypothetical protein
VVGVSGKDWLDVGRHGVRTVPTRALRLVLRQGAQLVERRAILVAIGPPGTGKTYAVLSLCEQLANWVYVPVDAGMTTHAFLHRLHARLGCKDADPALRGHILEECVTKDLERLRPVLVVDDANFLGRRLIAQFVFLQASADFALILVGHRLDELLRRHPELETRVARTVAFRRIRRQELHPTLAAYHDLFANADGRVLEEVDAHWANGNLRRWASFLDEALTNHAGAIGRDGLTRDVALRIVGAISGSRFGTPDFQAA